MRTPLELLGTPTTVDEYGQPVRTANAAGSGTVLFAAINDASADEKMNHRQMNQTVTHRIRMRWHPTVSHRSQLRTVSDEQGMVSRTWEVVTVVDWQERRQYLDLLCREIVT
jgi:SPP1 family predicted phage head-tail adaptor